jgi:hypothetical protein
MTPPQPMRFAPIDHKTKTKRKNGCAFDFCLCFVFLTKKKKVESKIYSIGYRTTFCVQAISKERDNKFSFQIISQNQKIVWVLFSFFSFECPFHQNERKGFKKTTKKNI